MFDLTIKEMKVICGRNKLICECHDADNLSAGVSDNTNVVKMPANVVYDNNGNFIDISCPTGYLLQRKVLPNGGIEEWCQ
jgi:hypothetical protein